MRKAMQKTQTITTSSVHASKQKGKHKGKARGRVTANRKIISLLWQEPIVASKPSNQKINLNALNWSRFALLCSIGVMGKP